MEDRFNTARRGKHSLLYDVRGSMGCAIGRRCAVEGRNYCRIHNLPMGWSHLFRPHDAFHRWFLLAPAGFIMRLAFGVVAVVVVVMTIVGIIGYLIDKTNRRDIEE